MSEKRKYSFKEIDQMRRDVFDLYFDYRYASDDKGSYTRAEEMLNTFMANEIEPAELHSAAEEKRETRKKQWDQQTKIWQEDFLRKATPSTSNKWWFW